MITPVTTPSTNQQLPTGAWSVALRDQLAKEAIAQMGPDEPEEHKLVVMEQLVEKLKVLRDYDRFDPRQMEPVVPKRNYREVDNIYVGSEIRPIQVLSDDRIVAGADDGTIRIVTKGADGDWSSEVLREHMGWVKCLQSLPDGRIVSGSQDSTIRIWTKDAHGDWNSEVLRGHTDYVGCLQALPDGRIVSGSVDNTIRIWTKTKDSLIRGIVRDWLPIPAVPKWEFEVFSSRHTNSVDCLQVLPDGRIFTGSDDRIRIWDGEEIVGGQS